MVTLSLHLASPPNANRGLGLICNGRNKPALKFQRSPVSSSLLIFSFQQPDKPILVPPPANQDVAAILLGDGSESKLWPLTKRRSAAAIPIAANFRLIDVVVSNCINSNITKIFALTQFNSTSLNSHLYRAYSKMGLGRDEFLEVIAAYQSPEYKGWFQGNADAVRRCLGLLEEHPVTEFLILPGHHLYRMDYQKLIQTHKRSKADITISCVGTGKYDQDRGFGSLKVNSKNQVLGIRDTQQNQIEYPALESDNELNLGSSSLTSMGIYVINKEVIIKILREYFPHANDFRHEVIPGAISLGMKVKAYVFEGYWDNMDSISAFYHAGIGITKQEQTGYNFYDRECPVYTLPHCLPPSKVTDALITNSVIGGGCFLNSCRINGSVLSLRTRVGYGAVIEDSIIMGSDTYEETMIANGKETNIPIGVGEGSLIRKAIIDKNARIGKRVKITNKDNVQEGSRQDHSYAIVDGIIVVMRSAIIPDGIIL